MQVMKVIVSNAFSLNMLHSNHALLHVQKISLEEARDFLGRAARLNVLESAIGHADTAAVVSSQLGFTVPANRATVSINQDTALIVAQYVGPRLPEGSTTLPSGARIDYYAVSMLPDEVLEEILSEEDEDEYDDDDEEGEDEYDDDEEENAES